MIPIETEPVQNSGRTLFLLAHCDDEFFILPRVRREVEMGSEVFIVFTTDGAANDADPQVRLSESVDVLTAVGVHKANILGIGAEMGAKDGESYRCIDKLFSEIVSKIDPKSLIRVYGLAWEGGHVDHDVVHLLGAALKACASQITLFEFSAYRRSWIGGPFFVCMSLLPKQGRYVVDKASISEAFRWFLSIFKYKTQRKTFCGLAPFLWRQVLARRACVCRVVDSYDYTKAPHARPLFYEKRFKVSFDEFSNMTEDFVSTRLM